MSFFINDALAEGAPAPAGAGYEFLIMMVVFFAIMYFLIIRPQAKRAKEHKALIEGLNKGDEIVTSGGLLGKIVEIDESFIMLQIATGVEIQIQRQSIGAVMPKGTFKKR
ncbi:MAG: preprotein translocase subunit YajC [Thiotrichales bacterium]